jgi:hypothetical protein
VVITDNKKTVLRIKVVAMPKRSREEGPRNKDDRRLLKDSLKRLRKDIKNNRQ